MSFFARQAATIGYDAATFDATDDVVSAKIAKLIREGKPTHIAPDGRPCDGNPWATRSDGGPGGVFCPKCGKSAERVRSEAVGKLSASPRDPFFARQEACLGYAADKQANLKCPHCGSPLATIDQARCGYCGRPTEGATSKGPNDFSVEENPDATRKNEMRPADKIAKECFLCGRSGAMQSIVGGMPKCSACWRRLGNEAMANRAEKAGV